MVALEDALRVVAIDPGKTTGFCFATLQSGVLTMDVSQEEISLTGLFDRLGSVIKTFNNVHIIYEDFHYRNYARTGLDLTPVKLIGVIECFREWHEPFVGFHKQSAATGKAFYSDDKLKALGIYKPGTQHGRDAQRHLMQWLTFGAGAQYCEIEKIKIELAV